ncbi:hypothetical protein VTN02DRAFT_3299 [Thermoascus thermophilus]
MTLTTMTTTTTTTTRMRGPRCAPEQPTVRVWLFIYVPFHKLCRSQTSIRSLGARALPLRHGAAFCGRAQHPRSRVWAQQAVQFPQQAAWGIASHRIVQPGTSIPTPRHVLRQLTQRVESSGAGRCDFCPVEVTGNSGSRDCDPASWSSASRCSLKRLMSGTMPFEMPARRPPNPSTTMVNI